MASRRKQNKTYLNHKALENSPSVQRFLASVPELEREKCLRVALVHGIRHFLTLQSSQGTILNYSTMHATLGPSDQLSNTVTQVRRPVQPGMSLAAFPFVDESRFETTRNTSNIEERNENNNDDTETDTMWNSTDNQSSSSIQHMHQIPPPSAPSAPAPANAVFASYPNWWPLENVIQPSNIPKTAAPTSISTPPTTATVEEATETKEIEEKQEKQEQQEQQEQQDQTEQPEQPKQPEPIKQSVFHEFNNIDKKLPIRTEIPKGWSNNSTSHTRPPLWEPKHRNQTPPDATEIDESLLVDKPAKKYVFKARKIPKFKKRIVPGGPRYSKIRSKIGTDVKQYRVAARRAKIQQNQATDQVMSAYADGVDGRGRSRRNNGRTIEAATLASAIVDSGIMADLLKNIPGPDVEIFPPPPKKNETKQPTYESIMQEIELEAALESRHNSPNASPMRESRRNYSSWVGDFGPSHTKMAMNEDSHMERDGTGGRGEM